MILFFERWLQHYGVPEKFLLHLSGILAVISIILIYIMVDMFTKKVFLTILKRYINSTPNKWDDILLESKFFARLGRILPVLVIYLFAPVFSNYTAFIQRMVQAYIVFIVVLVLNSLLDAIENIYWEFEVSKTKPIKGYLQVVQMIVWIIGIISIISVVLERSLTLLLSGIGAGTAVLLLIFQNSILGLVASIQLSSNDMLKIGDWISMPQYDADGDVLDISLHTVKIQNWDKTIVTVPTYKMTTESFVNWQGMIKSGGRRIKRHIYIDLSSIQFCTEEMLDKFEKIDYLKHYLAMKKNDIKNYNQNGDISSNHIVNGRHLTNIGTLRAYIEVYLQKHPGINQGMTHMVRQLQPTEKGLPLEIYAFTRGTAWVDYEDVQGDIFDHILAVIPEFGLRVYQAPAGYDMKGYNHSESVL